MRFIKIAGACAVIAVAIAVAPASVSYGASSDPELAVLTRQGISSARARQALDLQRQVAETHLAGKIESALAGGYAGVWFEPVTAQLHVGIAPSTNSPAATRIAAQAGLAGSVVETPVRSTWSELIAAQNQWNEKLAKLLAGAEAKTGIDSSHNAVSVTLSTSVPASERAALKREAAEASVNISISIVSPSQLDIKPRATCKAPFVEREAYCEKTLVSGVGIGFKGEKPVCTAGPMLIEGQETYMLTSGHCFTEVENPNAVLINEEVNSAYLNGVQKEIGKEVTAYYNKARDMAEVRIKPPPSSFTEGLPNPVPALMAEWKENPKTPHTVAGSMEVIAKTTVCHNGMISGENCGEIKAENVTFAGKEHLIEVTACGSKGDSGGPYFFRGKGKEVFMVGMETAGPKPECSEPGPYLSYFEPLVGVPGAVAFGILPTFGLALLTTANEVRPEHRFIVNGKTIGKGEKIEVQANLASAVNQLEGVVAKLSVHISCQLTLAPAAGNALEESGKLKLKVEYKACAATTVSGGVVENQPKCKVKEFAAEGTGELAEAGVIVVKGTPFATVHMEEVTGAGACTLAGEFKVEGSQKCSLAHYPVTVTVGVIECNPSGSKELKLGGEPAKLYSSIAVSGTKGQTLSSS
jgi:hypothetical protein